MDHRHPHALELALTTCRRELREGWELETAFSRWNLRNGKIRYGIHRQAKFASYRKANNLNCVRCSENEKEMIFLVRLLSFVSALSAGLGQKTNLGRASYAELQSHKIG